MILSKTKVKYPKDSPSHVQVLDHGIARDSVPPPPDTQEVLQSQQNISQCEIESSGIVIW